MIGTFSKPMPLRNGSSVPPAGDRFALGMVAVGQRSNGRADHE
jgi:hypothetical protein